MASKVEFYWGEKFKWWNRVKSGTIKNIMNNLPVRVTVTLSYWISNWNF
jgi:hypothetical protein